MTKSGVVVEITLCTVGALKHHFQQGKICLYWRKSAVYIEITVGTLKPHFQQGKIRLYLGKVHYIKYI